MARTSVNGSGISESASSMKSKHLRRTRLRADRAPIVQEYDDFGGSETLFEQFTQSCRERLAPSDPLEEILVSRVIVSAWALRSEGAEVNGETTSSASCAERSLVRGMVALARLRGIGSLASPNLRRGLEMENSTSPEASLWRERLTMDASVSPDSPVVKGTWITVGQVISRIVDGWSWSEILRSYPELCQDDIRACLAFTVEDEGSR